MAKRKLPKVVWKETIYSTSSKMNFNFFEKVNRMQMQKKGLKGPYSGLGQIYALYKWDEKSAVIYLSRKKVNTSFLKIETHLHEFLHYLNTNHLPTVIEDFIDDVIDLLL
jgi:hypothetical protein